MVTITKEIHNSLVEKFESRAKAQNLKEKSKAWKDAQADFFVGAVSAIDTINGVADKTCVTPNIMFTLMRGDKIKKYE